MRTSELIRARLRRPDGGFSFVELMAAIGLLSIVMLAAVPQMQNYQVYSLVTTMQTDARQFSSAAEAAYTISYKYPESASTADDPKFLKRAEVTPGNTVAFFNNGGTYRIVVTNERAAGRTVVWDSGRGGLQPVQRS